MTQQQKKTKLCKVCDNLWKLASAKVWGDKCIICGLTDQTTFHHYIPKSKSYRLRFDVLNAVPLCNSREHFILHHGDDPDKQRKICNDIVAKRGKKWYNYIEKNRKTDETSIYTLGWLEKQREILEHIIVGYGNIDVSQHR